MNKRIGIIGFGNMGSAIAEQLKSDYKIFVFDKDSAKISGVKGINAAQGLRELLDSADTLILAVKPQDFDGLLDAIKPYCEDKLIVSIAAGITTAYIEEKIGIARVIRAMPNMPAKISQGITCLSKGRFATEEDLDFAEDLFVYLGETMRIDEEKMNAVTAISGSGPAYVCRYLEAKGDKERFLVDFKKAAASLGFSSGQAKLLVNATFDGTLELLKKTKLAPSELKTQVTSKGGTTEAALKVLEAGGSLEEAVKAALKRAEELSKKE